MGFIDTKTNAVKHFTYVGRAPHEAFFTPDGTPPQGPELGTLVIRPKQLDGKPILRARHGDGPRATTDRAVLDVLIRSLAGLLCYQFDDLAAIWANERAALRYVIVHHLNSEPIRG